MKGLDDGKGSSGEKQCRYAYLIDQRRINYGRYYSFGGNFDPHDMRDRDYVPVVLEWGIDEREYESLVINNGSLYNSSYSSTCEFLNPSINSTNQSSTVQCSCSPGFEGNPYLSGICQGKLLVTIPTL
jgi:hypothetical protein